MYDWYELTSSLDLKRDANTRFYFLTPDRSLVDNDLKVPESHRDFNFVFRNKNGTDAGYLLNTSNPVVDYDSTVITLDRDIRNCFDIVFISNGESVAEKNYQKLLDLNLPNKIHRVDKVKGRNEAYKTAARLSETHHFFAVFAKLEINPEFDFSFGIDGWDRTHFVFNAKNPVNGLCYGHQALILYDKAQVLANPGNQIDFTMAQPFRQIDLLSGVAHFNYSPLAAWRCSFREVLKLLLNGNKESLLRVGSWLTGQGLNAEHCIQGTKDAIEFFGLYRRQPEVLLKSYDWEWLDHYFKTKDIK